MYRVCTPMGGTHGLEVFHQRATAFTSGHDEKRTKNYTKRQDMEHHLTSSTRQAVQTETEILSHAFLTIEEVALLLRVSKRTVYNLIYNGTLRATRVTYHVTVIQKEDFMYMIESKSYGKASALPRQDTRPSAPTQTDEENLSQSKGKRKAIAKPKQRQLIPSSAYRQSVRDTFTDGGEYAESQLYTMAEICRKYGCKYGWFYNLRMRYNIPCVKTNGTKCFPIVDVDKAMEAERERLGSDLSEHWYTCFDIMRIYGLGKTQIRRFAETHNVRIKKCGHCNHYLKADWDAARKKAETVSVCTKAKRE